MQFCDIEISVYYLISCASGVLIDDRIYPVIPRPRRFPDVRYLHVNNVNIVNMKESAAFPSLGFFQSLCPLLSIHVFVSSLHTVQYIKPILLSRLTAKILGKY